MVSWFGADPQQHFKGGAVCIISTSLSKSCLFRTPGSLFLSCFYFSQFLLSIFELRDSFAAPMFSTPGDGTAAQRTGWELGSKRRSVVLGRGVGKVWGLLT